jgi:hypothetical protein
MKPGFSTSTTVRVPRLAGLMSLLVTLVAAGCGSSTAARSARWPDIEDPPTVPPETLAFILDEFSLEFGAVTEGAADRIIALTGDEAVQKAAMRWKMQAIPVCYLTCFRNNPLAGLIDTWLFCAQLDQYFSDGDGRELFGEHQQIAVETVAALLANIRTSAETMTTPARFSNIEKLVEEALANHPIRMGIGSRVTPLDDFAHFSRRSRGALAAIEDVEYQFQHFARRTQIFAEHIPKQVRWQAELLTTEILRKTRAGNLVTELDDLEQALKTVSAEAAEIRELVSRERSRVQETVAQERAAALLRVDEISKARLSEAFAQIDEILLRAVLLLGPVCLVALLLLWRLVRATQARATSREPDAAPSR